MCSIARFGGATIRLDLTRANSGQDVLTDQLSGRFDFELLCSLYLNVSVKT
jgi:hypothetical protein